MRYIGVLIAVACGGVASGVDATQTVLPLPDLPTAQVAIPWSELKGLLEARVVPEEEEAKEKEKPPVEWTIGEARYTAVVEKGASARIEAAFEVYVWKPEGWTKIPLLAPTVAPVSLRLDGKPAPLVSVDGDMRGLLLESPGAHRVESTFFVPLKSSEGVVSLEYASAPAAINRLRLEIPVPDAVVQAPEAAGVEVAKSAKGVTAELAFRRTSSIGAAWRLPVTMEKSAPSLVEAPKPMAAAKPEVGAKPDGTATPEVKPVVATVKTPDPPSVTCSTATLAAVSERVLGCESLVVFSVQRGSADRFAFTLPAKVNVLSVEGQGSAWSRSVEGDVQRVEVLVNHAVTDQYTVTARYEVGIEDGTHVLAGEKSIKSGSRLEAKNIPLDPPSKGEWKKRSQLHSKGEWERRNRW